MSKLLEGQVWQSALDAELKPVAAVMADMGNQDGYGIYPSVEYIAWLVSKTPRSVQSALKRLVALGVLDRVANAKGGRGLTPRYRFNSERLPERPKWADIRKGEDISSFPDPKGCNERHERVKSTTQKGENISPDPLVDPSEIRQRSRARGYKQEPKPPEPKFLYPPPDFEITNSLYVWLAENCFSFTEVELREANTAWRESRESKPNHFARTLPMWQADWKKFIRVYWNIRQQRNGNGHKKQSEQEYTGPVKSKPNPKAENCPDCRGMGNIRFEIEGIWYAKPCKHEGNGVAAA